jgi:alpha-D-ribose 1-methylphosphonate 5-phosphate C-P lyase
MHAEKDYAPMWLLLYESLIRYRKITVASEYPCLVEDRYIMNPSPIPKFDNPRLHDAKCLFLFGAGREKKIYAIPPHTRVVPLAFEDVPFEKESFQGKRCRLCGSEHTYLDEFYDGATGKAYYQCSDTAYCREVRGCI